MTPETKAHLEKARECLRYARANLEADLANDAGRNAYLAEFHAAQALIFERTGKVAKTHSGVHTEFNRLGLEEREFGPQFRQILAQTYNLKAVADYETGPGSIIPLERAAAVESADRFVECVANVLLRGHSQKGS